MTLPALAITATLLITLGYAGVCAASPFGPCRKCKGMGHQLKADRRGRLKRGRDCRRCKATGQRIRVGRHLYNLARRTHGRATAADRTPAPRTDHR